MLGELIQQCLNVFTHIDTIVYVAGSTGGREGRWPLREESWQMAGRTLISRM